MIKKIYIFILTLNICLGFSLHAEESKNDITKITSDGSIKLFQNEKYYDINDNVKIKSKNFDLNSDKVIAYYDKDFYDLYKIIATGNAKLITSEGSIIEGDEVIYETNNEKFVILGNGIFIDDDLTIKADDIKGSFTEINNERVVKNVEAKMFKSMKRVFIQNRDMKSLSKFATYSKKGEILELFNDVQITKKQEVTTGDYANIDMTTNNYTISSLDNKVQLLISSDEDSKYCKEINYMYSTEKDYKKAIKKAEKNQDWNEKHKIEEDYKSFISKGTINPFEKTLKAAKCHKK
tara:strand:- start:2180 stop:3058 length:879 start_codon:yes stop_codon:yes gene_type:complete